MNIAGIILIITIAYMVIVKIVCNLLFFNDKK